MLKTARLTTSFMIENTTIQEAETDENIVLQNEREIATRIISVDDNPSLNPWTFQTFFIGLGLSAFGGSLGILLYPSKMLYPGILPLLSMFDAFYRDGIEARQGSRSSISCSLIFIWEIFPKWIFLLLTGLSIFCLAAPNNAAVSRVFGGSNGNEGLGLLSICFDWQYISSNAGNLMTIPLRAQLSSFIGYVLCMVVFVAVFYNNIWEYQNFPFLAQLLFYENGTVYDQTLIMNSNYEVDPTLVAEQGLPFYAGTWIINLLSTNLGLTATFTHLLLWNKDDLHAAWTWIR
ncbi:OPT oligopeptide transporter protein-domain-containing protein [Suillus subluteus]|nr:OPT oligopeptide transporter protein-domain-containing protein [Suillus subluteus]